MRAKDCQTKQDIRTEISRIDLALIELLAERHGYVTRMAEIKNDEAEAFDAARVAEVIKKIRGWSEEQGADPDQAELLWRTLIDWNVDFEKQIIRARRSGEQAQ